MQDKSVPKLTANARALSGVIRSGRQNERLRAMRDGTHMSLVERLEYALSLVPAGDNSLRKSAKQIGRYLGGADIPLSFLTELHIASGVPADWVISGRSWSESQVLRWLDGDSSDDEAQVQPGDFAFLPRYEARASAGAGLIAASEDVIETLAFRRDWLARLGVNPRNAGLLTSEGDSMHPTIPDRAIMLVDMSITEVRNGMIYVMVRDGEVLVKRIQVLADRSLILISDNERYKAETITRDQLADFHIAGRVMWVGHSV